MTRSRFEAMRAIDLLRASAIPITSHTTDSAGNRRFRIDALPVAASASSTHSGSRRSNSAGKLHISASAPAEKRSRLKSLESATDASVILSGVDDKLGRELKEFRSFGA